MCIRDRIYIVEVGRKLCLPAQRYRQFRFQIHQTAIFKGYSDQKTGTACHSWASKNTLHYQFILPLHTAESISNVHFILNQNCNLRNKSNGESETWAKWLTKGTLVCFCTVCVVGTLHSLWRCAWCLYIEFYCSYANLKFERL